MHIRLSSLGFSSLLMLALVGCAQDNPPQDEEAICLPECSPGYFCLAGTCVIECNPPCQGGLVCNADRVCATPTDPPDAGPDVPLDVDDDATPDTPPDVVPPTDVEDATPELDTLPDVEPTDVEPDGSEPWTEPYPRPECTTAADCDTDETCIAGGCATQVAPDDYVFNASYGYITQVYIPSIEDDPCCFDLDGNGGIDNQLSAIVTAWNNRDPGNADAVGNVNDAIASGINSLLVQLQPNEDGTASVALLTASNDVDLDGAPDQTTAERAAGNGVFRIDRSGMGAYGPQIQFPLAALSEGLLLTAVGDIVATIRAQRGCNWRWDEAPLLAPEVRCPGERPIAMTWSTARASFAHVLSGATVRSVDTTADGVTRGGLEVGGYLHLDAIAEVISNNYADNCQCAGIGTTTPFVESRIVGSRMTFACTQTYTAAELTTCVSGQRQCLNIPTFCQQVGLLSAFASYDSDGDRVADSISFGFSATVVPAAVAPAPAYIPAPELCGDSIDNDGDGRTDCDDPSCWDSSLCGVTFRGEYCRNGIDDDGDGLVDCADNGCNGNRSCLAE